MATMLHYAKKNTWPVKALSAVLGHKRLSLLALALVVWAAAESALAQGPAASVEAFSGEPLGVGRVTLQLPKQLLPEPLGVDGLGLSDKQGRVLYPAMHSPLIGNLLKEFLNADSPLTSGGPVREEVGGILRNFSGPPAGARDDLLSLPRRRAVGDDLASPPAIFAPGDAAPECGLAPPAAGGMVAGIYGRPPTIATETRISAAGGKLSDEHVGATAQLAAAQRKQTDSAYAQLEQEAGVMLETEGILLSMEQDRALGMSNLGLPADQPLPAPWIRRRWKCPSRTRKWPSSPSPCTCRPNVSTSASAVSATSSGSKTRLTPGEAICKTCSPSGGSITSAAGTCRTSSSSTRRSFRVCWAKR